MDDLEQASIRATNQIFFSGSENPLFKSAFSVIFCCLCCLCSCYLWFQKIFCFWL